MSDIYVISTGRNASSYVKNCVDSVQRQTLQPTKHILIDDISDDDTVEYISEYKKQNISNLQTIINKERKYRLKNIYENAIDKNPDDIICLVDSDDWLANDTALQTIFDTYNNNKKLEYVYSQYNFSHGALGSCEQIPSNNWDPYKNRWITSHMSTFKVSAIKDIPIENFLDWNGKWFEIATDHALTLPILYSLRKRDGDYSSVSFINEVLYTHAFYGNPSKPRSGTPEADQRSKNAVRCSTYIKQRGYIE